MFDYKKKKVHVVNINVSVNIYSVNNATMNFCYERKKRKKKETTEELECNAMRDQMKQYIQSIKFE